MKSMKAYMPILLLGFTFVTGTLAAEDGRPSKDGETSESGRLSKDGGLTIQNPCNSSWVVFEGTAHVTYRQEGKHAVARFRYEGAGTDNSADKNGYRANLEAEAHLDVTTSSGPAVYFFPYRAHFEGHGKAPDFKAEGTAGILVVDGVPTDDAVLSAQTTCSNSRDRDRD